jgi:hypothetical protein
VLVETSLDGSTWSTVDTLFSSIFNDVANLTEPVMARYIRFTAQSPAASGYLWGIKTVEIYQTAVTPPGQLSALPIGDEGQALIVSGGIPSWQDITGSFGGGGINRSGSTTNNHLAVWNGSNTDSLKDGGAVPTGGFGGDVYGDNAGVNGHLVLFDGDGHHLRDGGAPTGGYDVSAPIGIYTRSVGGGNYSTSSTSFVDVDSTNMSFTKLTGAHRLRIHFKGQIYVDIAGINVMFQAQIDGVDVGDSTYGIALLRGAADQSDFNFDFMTPVVSAGSHTIKLRWKVSGSTAYIYASTGFVQFYVEETPFTT